jgi:cell division protein FtsI/penicillin-binding protein 2
MSVRARLLCLLVFFLSLALLLVGRLFQLSIVDHDGYVAKAKAQQEVQRDVLPLRGAIYVQDATTGKPVVLAQSKERFALSATPRNVIEKEEYAALFAEISGGNEADILATLNNGRGYMEPLIHDLSKDQVEEIAGKILRLEQTFNSRQKAVSLNFDAAQGDIIAYLGGTFFIREYQRVYPEGALAGQVLGFVNDRGKGQYGFEAQYDEELKGYAGRVSLLRDSRGTALAQSEQVSGEDGTSYELTIDRNVQQIVEQELAAEVIKDEAKGGSVVVMDPKTGGIIAMANYPTYSPESFRSVAKDSASLFDNPAISSVWEPGSIFKPLIMAAAVDSGLVRPETTETFGSSITVSGETINTALDKAYGKESMTDVLVNSDNVAMVWLGDKLGNQKMGDYLTRFGFGKNTGVDLKNEIGGRLPDAARWSVLTRSTITFGQGVSVTPMQIASAYAAIANGGTLITPHVVNAVVTGDGVRTETVQPTGTRILNDTTAHDLRTMLGAVVKHNHKRAGVQGYEVGGKTGTAQVPDPYGKGYLTDTYNHSFAGMAPVDDPRYVMLVKIDQPNIQKVGQFAESTAVPLFGRLSRFLLHYYQVPPSS